MTWNWFCKYSIVWIIVYSYLPQPLLNVFFCRCKVRLFSPLFLPAINRSVNLSLLRVKFRNVQGNVFWLTCFLSFIPLLQDYRKAITERSLAAGSRAPWARRGSSMRVACVLAAALEGTRTLGRVWAWRRPAGCRLDFYAGWLSCPHPHCPDISSKDWKSTGDFLSHLFFASSV